MGLEPSSPTHGRLGLRGPERAQRSGDNAAIPTEHACEVREGQLVGDRGLEPMTSAV